MFSSLLITFRETLEAALVVGIILTFLTKTNQSLLKKYVWYGVGVGVLVSVVLAYAIESFFGGFEGKTEEIFEGVLMFITAGFLTWMILWVHRQKDIVKKIKERVAIHAKEGYNLGIFILVSTSVFREGTETVLYLKASSIVGQSGQLLGAVLGIIAALVFGYALFKWALHTTLPKVFNITSVFLLLFAAGLISHGVHEFQEVGALPVFSFDPVFDISQILDHKSIIGSFLRILFGYTSKPTLFELMTYVSYISFILWLERFTDRLLVKRRK